MDGIFQAHKRRIADGLLVLLAGGTAVWMFLGFGRDVPPAWRAEVRGGHAGGFESEVPSAVVYSNMDMRVSGPNKGFHSALTTLVSRVSNLTNIVINTDEARVYTLTQRASRRAFDGAPPVIPHPVDDHDIRSCYACHGEGREIGGRIAAKISHKRFTNCTQCHAAVGNRGVGPAMESESDFIGAGSPGRGIRVWDGAPPTIPHKTFMRENCTGCHGLLGREGIRSTHSWRMNCLQCHAGNAEMDGYDFSVDGAIGTVSIDRE